MITQKYLKECVDYDEFSGILYWKCRSLNHFNCERICNSWNAKFAGEVCGSIRREKRKSAGTKYIEITLTENGTRKTYFAHRLIWLYMIGEFPEQVDHIDGDGLNNKWKNLKLATNIENSMNCRMSKNNTSGFNGISWHKRDEVWSVSIRINGNLIHGGSFTNINDAISKREQLNINYGFHPLHGLKKKGDYK